jgi:hypothetical protein
MLSLSVPLAHPLALDPPFSNSGAQPNSTYTQHQSAVPNGHIQDANAAII